MKSCSDLWHCERSQAMAPSSRNAFGVRGNTDMRRLLATVCFAPLRLWLRRCARVQMLYCGTEDDMLALEMAIRYTPQAVFTGSLK